MFKLIVLVFSLKIIATAGERSFTVVLDTTVSMSDEINIIKANIGQMVNSINRTDIENYILVPFKDILIESPIITTSPRYFTSRLNTITTSGGSDCPENSLAGIEAALRASKQESFIFVFTDAYAKDYKRLQSIETLCRESHSQVIIFLSGFCLPSRTSAVGDVDVYYDVAKACSGSFFRFDSTYDLRQAFSFMKEVMNTEWTDITPLEMFTNHKELTYTVDTFTTDLLIGVSGSNPTLNIFDANDQQPPSLNRVLSTRQALAVHLSRPDPGEYSVSIQGYGKMVVTYYERNYIPFQYGFSIKLPRSLMETSTRPLVDAENYVLIKVDSSIQLESIEWLNAGESAKKVLYLEEKHPGLYVSSKQLVEPGKTFRIWIIGEDAVTRQKIKGSTKYIFPQVPVSNVSYTRPNAEILDTDLSLIDYGTELTLACKVTGFPKSNIRWESSNGDFPAEDVLLEIPSIYISYVTLSNVTKNSTIFCKAENSVGDAANSIDIFVNRTFSFDVEETPEDTSVEYGADLSLPCQVNAYPEATIEWHFNGSKIDEFSNPNVDIHEDMLTVKNVSLADGGDYDCIASNEVESRTFTATVSITGLEAPEVEIRDAEIDLKPGDWADIECTVTKGKPTPQVTWQYKAHGSFDYGDVTASEVTVEDGKVKISSANKEHGGVYRCTASNLMGQDSKDITVKIQFAPTIKNDALEMTTVREGDNVLLECDVEAIPKAAVQWEMNQNDVAITLGDRHTIDEDHTLRFTAYWNDSGNYHCIAQNDVGRAERTVTLNVLVPPFIETPKSKSVNSRSGGQVGLTCNVLYGTPPPTIKWKFIAVDSTSTILARNKSTLRLENVTQNDEGTYMCIAENEVGIDRIKYSLQVH